MALAVQTLDLTDVARALRKGRLRYGILRVLHREGELTVPQLVEKLRSDRDLVVWAINGHPPKFREAYALTSLGLVRWIWRPTGLSVVLTDAGSQVATSLAEGWQP